MRIITMRKQIITLCVASLAVAFSGCVSTSRRGDESKLVSSTYLAVDRIVDNLESGPGLAGGQPVVVASFVNVDNMLESSALGRMLAEQISSRLAQSHQYQVIELKLRRNIFIKEQAGEFVLSREVKSLAKSHQSDALVVGTYAVGHETVYISARVVNPTTNEIMAAHDFTLPLDNNMRVLLGYKRISRASWWSRIWGGKDVWGKGEHYEYYPEFM